MVAWAHIKILGMDFLTFFDYISNSVLMPIVALCTCILIGWVAGAKTVTDEVKRNGEKMNREKLYNVMIKYIAPGNAGDHPDHLFNGTVRIFYDVIHRNRR